MPDDGNPASPRRRAKLFTHGGSQAVRLPKEFRFEGKEVSIRKEGDTVVLSPVKRDWAAIWDEIDRLRGDGEIVAPEDPPPEDVRF
jgi:antitoxin VapB